MDNSIYRAEWITRSFGELIQLGVLEIGDGYRAKNDELGGQGLIFLRAGHVKSTHIEFEGVEFFKAEGKDKFGPKVSHPGDVVVTTKGNSTGRMAFVTSEMPPFVYSPHLSYWRSKSANILHPGFLRIWSRGGEFLSQLEGLSRSTDMAPYLSLSDQRRLRITLPSPGEQARIGALGDALDDRIALLRETNATLEAIAQALFKSWFVDFDPVRAKQQGLTPEEMDEATAALFPDEFEESELGLVPKGWKFGTVDSFAERVGMGPFGANIKVSTFVERGVPIISGQHLKQALVEDNTFNYITEEHAEKLAKSCVRAGDVIFTHAGSIGQVGLLHAAADFGKYVLSQRQFFLRCDFSRMRPEWVMYYFRSPQGQHQLLANTSQVGVPSIARPVTYLRSIQLLIPPMPIIDRFSSIADAFHQRVMLNRQQLKTLSALRDTLLPRLIAGQLRLPEAQAELEGALP